MAKKRVTLQATLPQGQFYWVCAVDADSEEEAVIAAENLFEHAMEKSSDWSFTDFQVDED